MKVIDLTQYIEHGMTVYPGTEQPEIVNANTIAIDGFAEKAIKMVSHTGTHIDAPCHIIAGGKSLDQFPVQQFMGPAIVIAVNHVGPMINLEDLKTLEKRISHSEFILFKTGWSDKWMTDAYFEGFPVLSQDAAKWLTGFHIKGIGLDCISLDPVGDNELPNHHIVLGHDIFIIENLTNLDQLPETDYFTFQCLPMKIKDADGAPVRAVGIVESGERRARA